MSDIPRSFYRDEMLLLFYRCNDISKKIAEKLDVRKITFLCIANETFFKSRYASRDINYAMRCKIVNESSDLDELVMKYSRFIELTMILANNS